MQMQSIGLGNQLKIKISSCYGWNRSLEARTFAEFNECFTPRPFCLIDDFASADVILVTDIHHRNSYRCIMSKPEHVTYYNKIICYSEMDFPPCEIPGVYSSSSNLYAANCGTGYFFHWKWIDSRFGSITVEYIPPRERKFYVSFWGRACNRLRKRILLLDKVFGHCEASLIDTRKTFGLFDHSKKRDDKMAQQRVKYLEGLSQSTFALCPRGAGLSSIRLFECMKYGAIPVVVSDDLRLPKSIQDGYCCIRVPERNVECLPSILREYADHIDTMSNNAREVFKTNFEGSNYWNNIVDGIRDIAVNSLGERSPIYQLRARAYYRDASREVRNAVRRLKNKF